jgi:mRNA interferase MazF
MTMELQQGDIVTVRFPFSDGSEFKKRPALIVSNKFVNQTNEYIIVQITSKYYQDNLTIEVNDADCLTPLPLKSFIRTHKICTLHQSVILSKFTSVHPDFLKTVNERIALNLKT